MKRKKSKAELATECLKHTDALLAGLRRDDPAVELIVAQMGEEKFNTMVAELKKLRAHVAAKLAEVERKP